VDLVDGLADVSHPLEQTNHILKMRKMNLVVEEAEATAWSMMLIPLLQSGVRDINFKV